MKPTWPSCEIMGLFITAPFLIDPQQCYVNASTADRFGIYPFDTFLRGHPLGLKMHTLL
uniref:Uncharacterized protein n=1 Tax=Picea sitchensis TaxID=3332 RepID=A0A6B9XS32_PICSI|nr:hypothetical protein Q903MT_gene5534 [Picea sitchensis]